MPLNNQEFLQNAPKSERVVQLLAVCIRTAVRFRYAPRELSRPDAIDLARKHDLFSAMKAISAKMELHQNLPSDEGRFKLAVNEAKDLDTENIIAMREASIAVLQSSQATASQRHLVVAGLYATQHEAQSWAKTYSRFVAEISSLYKSTNARIEDLHIPVTRRLKAQSELEQIIVDAIRRVGKIDSSH
jgi:hypothetical protein